MTLLPVCDDDALTLLLCAIDVGTTSCYDCTAQLSNPLFNMCSCLSEVQSFCNAVESCMNACHQDCKAELQTTLTCFLYPCDADTCSHISPRNNGTVIAAAAAAVGIIGVALAIYYRRKRASNV